MAFGVIVFLLSCALINVSMACDFDEVSDNILNIPKLYIEYGCERSKRSTEADSVSPLRFHVYYDDTHPKLKDDVKSILDEATARISELLSVNPVNDPIAFERTACSSRWSHGINHGRCASINSKYVGEFCENKIDNFRIPEQHLQTLDVYNFTGAEPIFSVPDPGFTYGKGIENADFVLYAKSEETVGCKDDVMAYASYCRLDQHSRPVAGLINFCPTVFDESLSEKNRSRLVKVAIHELIHVLGFSKDLFSHCQGCQINSLHCEDRKKVITQQDNQTFGLNFPTAVEMLKKHLSCSDKDLSVPLDSIDGSYTSHFDPLLFFGSIMAPTIQDVEYTFIDLVTLAILADSGWYKVNFSAADNYTWGKDSGCSLGKNNNCTSSENFEICPASDQVQYGCDFHHNTRTSCQKLSPVHECGVLKPDFENDCRKESQRCFVTKEDDVDGTICATVECKSAEEYNVLIDGNWLSCEQNMTEIATDGNWTLVCPNSKNFCLDFGKEDDVVVTDLSENNIKQENLQVAGASCNLNAQITLWLFLVLISFTVIMP